MNRMPLDGLSRDEILATLDAYQANDLDRQSEKAFGYTYDAGLAHKRLAADAYSLFLGKNGLDPTFFPSLLRLENEVVAIGLGLLGGDDETCGSFTSGGTESIMLAVKAARDFMRQARRVRRPQMILPQTAHAAFHKAGHYLDVEVVATPVDPTTFRADVAAVRRAIGPETILIVGSAPSYAHGVVDPIRELGEVALEHDLLLHVDACIGGFLLPYLRRLGAAVGDFDLSVPGVTSISVDLHKYAYAPKGASLVLYRRRVLRRSQFYACARWTGYSVLNPTVQSTKSGGPLAAAWAALHAVGDAGYMQLAGTLLAARRRLVAGIGQIDGLRVLGEPDASLLAFTSNGVDPFVLADEMVLRGWYVQPQLAFGPSPANLHLTLTPASAGLAGAFLSDLAIALDAARAAGPSCIAPVAAGFDLAALSGADLGSLFAALGMDGAALPARMAPVHGIMNGLDPAATEALLLEYLDRAYSLRAAAPTG